MKQRLCFLTTILLVAAGLSAAPRTSAVDTPSCSAYASSIVAGPDGNLWIGEYGDREIGRVPPGGGAIAEFPLDVPPLAKMVPGPDGNVWVLRNWDQVARVAPDGHMDTFDLPRAGVTSNSLEKGLAVGPDGNIWAMRTMNGDDRLTQVTPIGVVTDFPIDVVNPNALVAAAGSLWFLDHVSGATRLLRADVAGNITLAQTFSSGRLVGLVAGPDGALWSVSHPPSPQGLELLRIPTDGSDPASFALPLAWDESPSSLIVGPDARLWAVVSQREELIAVDTSGAATMYPYPSEIEMRALTSGPDGNVWFAASDDVGSVSTSGALLSRRTVPLGTGSAIACGEPTPAFGRTVGGETITLKGRGFQNVTDVWFDSTRAPSFSVVSEREMTVVTPAHARGFTTFVLDTVAGRQPFNTQFRFAGGPFASAVCPDIGPTTGGYWVTLSGDDVDLATLVSFGGTLSTTVRKVFDPYGYPQVDKLDVLVPARRGGVVKLQASGPLGTGPKGARFVYTQAAPVPVGLCLSTNADELGLLPDA